MDQKSEQRPETEQKPEPTGKNSALLKGTDAQPYPPKHKIFSEETDEVCEIRQKSLYNDRNRARIDNNQFFETRSNPLSSKGN